MRMRLGLWLNLAWRILSSPASITLFLLVATSNAFALDEPIPVKFAAKIPNAQEILERISGDIPFLMRLVTGIAYVSGMYFIITAVFKLKQYGEARTQMSQQHHLKEPIMYFVAGTLLLYLPTAVNWGFNTFWNDVSAFSYKQESAQWQQFYDSVFLAVRLFGTIAFIRGLVILARSGGGHGQPGTLAKGMTHIIGGLFCINIDKFVMLLLVSLGILSG